MSSAPGGNCSVCDSACPKLHLNYGVFTCNNCRAFFRRTSTFLRQNGQEVSDLKCKSEDAKGGGSSSSGGGGVGECFLGPNSSRKLCMRCRYKKCLAKGMRRDQVNQVHLSYKGNLGEYDASL